MLKNDVNVSCTLAQSAERGANNAKRLFFNQLKNITFKFLTNFFPVKFAVFSSVKSIFCKFGPSDGLKKELDQIDLSLWYSWLDHIVI